MERGAILPPVSTAAQQRAAPADIPQRTTAITAIPPVLGASILTPNIAVQRPVPAAAQALMIMQITPIRMVRGRKRMIPSISARNPAPPAATAQQSMPTMWTQTATASAMIAVQLSA